MASALLLAGALLAQAGVAPLPAAAAPDRVDVAYEDLAQGRSQAAISRINANRELESDDPAALINLGTAHARIGQKRQAAAYYMAAIATPNRYDLELADGRWMDSRRAARLAIEKLPSGEALAIR